MKSADHNTIMKTSSVGAEVAKAIDEVHTRQRHRGQCAVVSNR